VGGGRPPAILHTQRHTRQPKSHSKQIHTLGLPQQKSHSKNCNNQSTRSSTSKEVSITEAPQCLGFRDQKGVGFRRVSRKVVDGLQALVFGFSDGRRETERRLYRGDSYFSKALRVGMLQLVKRPPGLPTRQTLIVEDRSVWRRCLLGQHLGTNRTLDTTSKDTNSKSALLFFTTLKPKVE